MYRAFQSVLLFMALSPVIYAQQCTACLERRVAVLELKIVRELSRADLLTCLPDQRAPLDDRIKWLEQQSGRLNQKAETEPASPKRVPAKGDPYRNFRADEVDWLDDRGWIGGTS